MRNHSAQATTTNVSTANSDIQASTNRYAYDRAGRRVLTQEGITEQSDVQSNVVQRLRLFIGCTLKSKW